MNPVSLSAQHLLISTPIVIPLLLLIPIMPEPIPLTRTLRVKTNLIIIDTSRRLVNDSMTKSHTVETRRRHRIKRPVHGNANTVLNLLGRSDGVGRRETVQHAELVFGAPEAPGVAMRPVFEKG